jgi:hypothetical protein
MFERRKIKIHEFCDVFAWSYVDLHGFDPYIVQHVIPINDNTKPVRQRQRPVNPALEATI